MQLSAATRLVRVESPATRMAASLTILIVGLRLYCSLAQFLTNVLKIGVIVVILVDGKTEEVIYRPLIRLLYSPNLIIKIFLPLAEITASQRSFGRVQSPAEVKFSRTYPLSG